MTIPQPVWTALLDLRVLDSTQLQAHVLTTRIKIKLASHLAEPVPVVSVKLL